MTKRGRKPLNLSGLDWSKRNTELAAQIGCSSSTIRNYRLKAGEKSHRKGPSGPVHSHRLAKLRKQWDALNWNLQDAVLAREMRCSRENVRQWRVKLGKPKSPVHRQCTDPAYAANCAKVRNQFRIHGVTEPDAQLAARLNVTASLVSKVRRDLGMERFDRDAYFDLADWRLSNKDLGKIWGRSAQLFANVRCQTNRGAPTYEIRFGRYPTNDRNYQKALNVQMDEAARWRLEHGR